MSKTTTSFSFARRIRFFVALFFSLLLSIPVYPWTVTIAWDPNSPTPGGYRVYYAGSAQNISSGTVIDVGLATQCTITVPDSTRHIVMGVTAYSAEALESDMSELVYWIFGDIYGTDNDGVPWNQLRLDGFDLAALSADFGKQRANAANRFCDINKDGRVDGKDLGILASRFGYVIPAP